MKQKILAILPISIGGRLTTSSIIDGFRQNDYDVVVYDELFPKNNLKKLQKGIDEIEKYDILIISAIKIPRQLYYAQSTTGGRLGVRQCQM